MKKLLVLLVVCLLSMSASAINFTNNVKYKISFDGWWPDGPVQLSDSEDGSAWQRGHIIQSHPTFTMTNLPVGVTADIGRSPELYISQFTIVVTADEIAAESGANLTKKALNAIKKKVRELGVVFRQELEN